MMKCICAAGNFCIALRKSKTPPAEKAPSTLSGVEFFIVMYAFFDKFFSLFHALLIGFSLCGWMWKKTRRANLLVLPLIADSWFVLGLRYPRCLAKFFALKTYCRLLILLLYDRFFINDNGAVFISAC